MTVTSRTLAFQILLHLAQKASHPDRLIRIILERHSGLDERDRALLTELVYGVVRWQGRLDWHIDQLSRTKPDKIANAVRVLLRLALYQIFFLDRIPDHAAVNDTVAIAKTSQPPHVVKFINAILREAVRKKGTREKVLLEDPVCTPEFALEGRTLSLELCPGSGEWNWPDPLNDPAAHMATVTSHPVWAVQKLIEEIGLDETRFFCTANNRVTDGFQGQHA